MKVIPLERDYTEANSRLRLMYFREGESGDGEGKGGIGRPGWFHPIGPQGLLIPPALWAEVV